jgi:outer membrane protein OmpA-like peptidoglycan-associated protein/ABC-type nitrate/sulfonate/bicarbonate transport system substrate-binding protein
MRAKLLSLLIVLASLGTASAQSVSTFTSLVGDVKPAPFKMSGPVETPYLFWGGDLATFVANGGAKTTADSTYGKLGLSLNLVPGDDFIQQVRNYVGGKTPLLRGTFAQIAQASEVIGADPSTKPVIILQLTWSAGDHMVVRDKAHLVDDKGVSKAVLDKRSTLNDLKGKTFCLQQGGPHVDFLDDALKASKNTWADIKVVWVKDLTGPNGPAAMMRKDPTIDVACVITPDMLGLCGGSDSIGTGAEETVLGSHVVVSTAQMSRSIADMYAVRSDFLKENREWVQKFTAGYLKGVTTLVNAKLAYNDGMGKSPEYMSYLTMAQQTWGEKNLPTLEVDAHGLVSDASFVGVEGNLAFFDDAGNLNGFTPRLKSGLDLVTKLGFAKERVGFDHAHWDWGQVASIVGLEIKNAPKVAGRIKAEALNIRSDMSLDDKTLASFDINFGPDQTDFDIDVYSADFQQVVQTASTFGNSVILIRGHSDPTKTIQYFVQSGLASGTLKRTGSRSTGYQYYLKGQPFDMTQMPNLINEIAAGNFRNSETNPQELMVAALNLSQVRAENVKKALIDYAKSKGVNLDPTQIQPAGVGIREPIVARPQSLEDMAANRRVEFRIIKVSAEAVDKPAFDF